MQSTSKLFMVSPTRFGFNQEAFETNKFQTKPTNTNSSVIQSRALDEFNLFVSKLRKLGVDVHVFNDFPDSETPDSIFPNNWVSTHRSGDLILYPMAVSNRRAERRKDIIQYLINKFNYKLHDLSGLESEIPPQYLEGTGSVIFDHINKIAFAAISPRTNLEALNKLGQLIGYKPTSFHALGKAGELIYHTNVMMCIGKNFISIGLDTVIESERVKLKEALEQSGKEIIYLRNDQIYNHFAGNMLQIENSNGESILILSQKAYDSLDANQMNRFQELNDHLLSVSIPTIEAVGGGSVRCMLAEIFPPNV